MIVVAFTAGFVVIVVVVQKLLCWISNASAAKAAAEAAPTYDNDVECVSVNVPYGC